MIDELILVGDGGHCKSCIDVIESSGHAIKGIISKEITDKKIAGYNIIGTDDSLADFSKSGYSFLITVGQIKSSVIRSGLYAKIKNAGGKLATIVAAESFVSKHSNIGEGTIIMHHAIVNAASTIGVNCIINNKALVEHDCIIGNHTHISTAAVINGACKIGNHVFIGSNSVLAHGIEIADEVVVGAGSVVVKNILAKGIYAGNPAIKIGGE